MERRLRELLCLGLAVLTAVLLLRGMVLAQSGGGYDLSWSTVDGGGATFSVGGSYVQGGTVGQPDACMLTGSSYALLGGWWGGGVPVTAAYEVYLPVLVRNAP